MPYTFGAATADDVAFAKAFVSGGNGQAAFVWGWWMPTTLTATRGLWSLGNTIGAEIDTTTSELRLRTDGTVDGQYTTTGAALAVNKWSFFAFLFTTNNTGMASKWVVWMGTEDTAPREITVTQATAPTVGFTGNATFYLGNKGTGTLAFQGDIACGGCRGTQVTGAGLGPFLLAAQGAITAAEAEFTLNRYVLPAWLGEKPLVGPCVRARGTLIDTGSGDNVTFINLDTTPATAWEWREQIALAAQVQVPTINGATPSLKRGPRPNPALFGNLFMPPLMRR